MRQVRSAALIVTALSALACGEPDAHSVLAFRDVRVFDGERTHTSTSVVVEDGIIVSVGRDLSIPSEAEIREGDDLTLLPGLIDAHTHIGSTKELVRTLMFGVTTVLDMGTRSPEMAAAFRQRRLEGGADHLSDFFSAGVTVTPPGGHGTQFVESRPTLGQLEDTGDYVRARVDEGSDYIKIIYETGSSERRADGPPILDEPVLRAAVAAAHERGKLAVVHVNTLAAAAEVAQAGADGLAHLFYDRVATYSVAERLLAANAFVVPTLTVFEGMFGSSSGGARPLANDPRLAPYLGPDEEAIGNRFRTREGSPWARMIESVRILNERGVPIVAGTDAPNAHGVYMHRELESLVLAGLTPEEALASATSVAADAFRLEDRGRIAPGLRADLVLVRGDPTVDITVMRDIVGLWKLGRAVDRAAYRERKLLQHRALQGPGELFIHDFEDGEWHPGFGQISAPLARELWPAGSRIAMRVIDGGAGGSAKSLEIRGFIATAGDSIDDERRYPSQVPGAGLMVPVDLSAKTSISFRARGEESAYRVFLFTRPWGSAKPTSQTFFAGADWTEVTLDLADFSGADLGAVGAFVFSADLEPGEFRLQIDDLRIW